MKDWSRDLLAKRLKDYHNTKILPLHMPGHKRNLPKDLQEIFQNIEQMDVTEVFGTDSLHTAEGIIREAQEYAAKVYGSDTAFFLVNGSSCGILSAIRACMKTGRNKILLCENAHISAHHAIELCAAETVEIPVRKKKAVAEVAEPEFMLGVEREDLVKILEQHAGEASAVFITSPTYEGIISDIKSLAELVHSFDLPLIVDEAHGAYLHFMERAEIIRPSSAVSQGADIIIQSLHKTLPAFTQTAILHVNDRNGLVQRESIRRNLMIFETSSPSYIFMASIDAAIRYMEAYGKQGFSEDIKRIRSMRKEVGELRHICIWNGERDGNSPVYEADPYKMAIYTRKKMPGAKLQKILREDYCIETEMAGKSYVLMMFSLFDPEDCKQRVMEALHAIDQRIESGELDTDALEECPDRERILQLLRTKIDTIAEKAIAVYPPDIPIVKRGELLTAEKYIQIEEYIKSGCNVIGLD